MAESSSLSGVALPTAHTPDGEPSAALVVLQTVDGRRFNSLTEVTEHLKSLKPEDRYRVVNAQAERLIEIQETSDASMSYLNEYVKKDGAFSRRMEQDPETWKKVEEAATRHQTQRNRKLESQNKIFETWGEEEVRSHFAHVFDMGETTWSRLRRVATLYPDLKVAILRIRGASLWRIQHPAIGRDARSLLPVGADFDAAARRPEKVADAAALATSGFGVDEHGWLVPARRVLGISEQDEQEDSDLSEMPEGLEEEFERFMHRGGAKEQGRFADERGSERSLATSDYVTSAQESEPAVDTVDEEEDEEEEREAPARKKRKRGGEDSDDEAEAHKCGCAAGVPRSFINKCSTKRTANPGQQAKVVKEWFRYVNAGQKVCHRHGRNIASIAGMQIRTLSATRLEERLRAYYRAAISNSIGELKVGKDTFSWFRM